MFFYIAFSVILLIQVQNSVAVQPSAHCRSACINPGFNWSCESCKTGCFGRTCDQRCRRCDSEGCDKITGRCYNCKPGYYGEDCDTRCSKGCAKNLNGIRECDRSTGFCFDRCKKGFHGEQCSKKCPEHCGNSFCSRYSGICLHGCEKGWGGHFCNQSCGNCLHGMCDVYGMCKHGCKDGYYGNRCQRQCINCDGERCDGETGKCFQCKAGFYGPKCTYLCSQNCGPFQDGSKPCDRDSGRCMKDCLPGTYGYHCSHRCNKNCKFSQCSVHDGFCSHGCREGWTGFECERPRNCLGDRHDGDKCTYGCNVGMTGASCDVVCPVNCKSCDQLTGRCTSCHDGYFGDACVQECSFRCKRRACNMDGSCTVGCVDGFHGYHCNNLCDLFCLTCNRLNSKCTSCIEGIKLTENGKCPNDLYSYHLMPKPQSLENSGNRFTIGAVFPRTAVLIILVFSRV